ncbi:flagellar motor switch protein FliG [Sphingobium jiangsuense]|uniref:Flagellar motor switch protein FliG n=1 Tax=Sphingobium jiangsuense TaxID=870476 RepID=A0A7W6FNM8_9SPHN|nr:flagellar motor switch protein FliG [Sphingobium jiangsuense]MBB3924973.1 flagellar motor switch protein FliG [Sphingobium jiangsuense]GLT00196.1 flagellar motor switch protein FliG [Sphingobium jiangsuense]
MPEAALADENREANPLHGSAAAAVLLMLFSEDEAAEILSRLEPDEVRQLGFAMYDVADVEIDEVNQALDQFVNKAKRRTTIGYGAPRHIRGAMHKALGPERADNILARITPPTASTKLTMLKWMEAREIAAIIENEHPQVMAVVLTHLEPRVAADVLSMLPAAWQEDVVYRVATLGPVPLEALDELEIILANAPIATSTGATSQRGGTSEAAAIMNNVRKDMEQRIIKALNKRDKNVAQTIEEEMFIFDNLIDLDDKNMGALLRGVDTELLTIALKGANEMLKAKMLGCMSQRAAQSIQDEMEERGPMRLAEVIEAQKAVVSQARRLAEQGVIMLAAKGDEFV